MMAHPRDRCRFDIFIAGPPGYVKTLIFETLAEIWRVPRDQRRPQRLQKGTPDALGAANCGKVSWCQNWRATKLQAAIVCVQGAEALTLATAKGARTGDRDDTPLPVLYRQRRRTRTARFWSYAIDDRPWQGPAPPAVVYLFAGEFGRTKHVREHLTGFGGVLQVDRYAGYRELAKPGLDVGGAVTLAYCLAHARRRPSLRFTRSRSLRWRPRCGG